jgi:hypothetical protein
MNKTWNCQDVEPQLPFYVAAETLAEESEMIQAHLSSCDSCRQKLTEQEQLYKTLQTVSSEQVQDSMLYALRSRLAFQIQRESRPRRSRYYLKPAWQAAMAVLFLLGGFALGRFSGNPAPVDSAVLQQLLTAEQTVNTAQGAIDPYLNAIEKVKYDPASGMVEIQYNTINNVSYRAGTDNPVIRQMLRQAVAEEQNPAARLNAVRTMQAIAIKEQGLDTDLLTAIEYLLQKEQNQGVRLMALKVLKSVPMNEAIKHLLLRVLLYDQNMALRIQAFETLTGQQAPKAELEKVLHVAKTDTSTYIRYRAEELLKQMHSEKSERKNSGRELDREG